MVNKFDLILIIENFTIIITNLLCTVKNSLLGFYIC